MQNKPFVGQEEEQFRAALKVLWKKKNILEDLNNTLHDMKQQTTLTHDLKVGTWYLFFHACQFKKKKESNAASSPVLYKMLLDVLQR